MFQFRSLAHIYINKIKSFLSSFLPELITINNDSIRVITLKIAKLRKYNTTTYAKHIKHFKTLLLSYYFLSCS